MKYMYILTGIKREFVSIATGGVKLSGLLEEEQWLFILVYVVILKIEKEHLLLQTNIEDISKVIVTQNN